MFDNFSLQLLRQQNNGIFSGYVQDTTHYTYVFEINTLEHKCLHLWLNSKLFSSLTEKSNALICQIFLIWEIIENMCYNVWNQINRQLMFAHWEAFLMEKVIASVYVFLETLIILSACHTVWLGWHNRWLELQYIVFR